MRGYTLRHATEMSLNAKIQFITPTIMEALRFGAFLVILPALYLISIYNYLLFHSLVEMFAVFVAFGIFVINLYAGKFNRNGYLNILGTGYLFVGILDLLHAFAYPGMSVLKATSPDAFAQLWLAARYVEAISLFIAPYFWGNNLKNSRYLVLAYSVLTFSLIISILYFKIWPPCFIDHQGVTVFKKINEYVISAILLGAMYSLYRKKAHFDSKIIALLCYAMALTIVSELTFTLYVDAYGTMSFIGHLLKIASFYLIYKVMISTAIQRPFDLLFRDLREKEESLRARNQRLEETLDQVKCLKGLIPICAWCKKVRDDQGYWTQLEKYFHEHSAAEFSHGLCPHCAEQLYPKAAEDE